MVIEEKIKEILMKIIGDRGMQTKYDTNIFLSPISIDSTEFVYFTVELMKYFDVQFEACDFENYGFSTIRGITKVILKYKMQNENTNQ